MSDLTPGQPVVSAAPTAAQQPLQGEVLDTIRAEEEIKPRSIEVRDQNFKTAERLPGIVLLDLGLASDPEATQGEQLRAMRQFLQAAIHPDDIARFEVYLRRAQPVIEMEELNKVIETLITEVAGRPT